MQYDSIMQTVKFRSGANELVGSVNLANNASGGVLFIAGGGAYTKELYKEWQEHLAANGYHSFAFDFPGIGNSGGQLTVTSLSSRLLDASNALDWFVRYTELPQDKIVLCGRSMGGPLALRLASEKNHPKVALLYPAAYADAAYDKCFGSQFSEALLHNS